jgi:quinolinate synthase
MKSLFEMSPEEQTDYAADRLANVYPKADIEIFLPLILEINQLKKKKKAVLLGHNYMTPEIFHGVSDFVGDSLALSREAANTQAEIILFNGVYFMAESAKILSPKKKVLIADPSAGCSLVDNITAEDVIRMKKENPGAPVVTYINSSAAVKAETDVCCTSANAARIINSLKEDSVIFIPDSYLASNVALETGKKLIPFNGSCEVHRLFTAEDIIYHRKQWPGVKVLAHPECSREVTAIADFTGSTSGIINWIKSHPQEKKIMLVTECSMGDNIRAENGNIEFIGTCHACPHMKKITLPKILATLKNESNEVTLDEEIRRRALRSLERMLELS